MKYLMFISVTIILIFFIKYKIEEKYFYKKLNLIKVILLEDSAMSNELKMRTMLYEDSGKIRHPGYTFGLKKLFFDFIFFEKFSEFACTKYVIPILKIGNDKSLVYETEYLGYISLIAMLTNKMNDINLLNKVKEYHEDIKKYVLKKSEKQFSDKNKSILFTLKYLKKCYDRRIKILKQKSI
jgi:hypothetical protein